MNSLDKILLLKPIIDKITDGGMFKFMFAWFFRIMAALTIIGALYASWKLWGNLNSKMPAKYFIGGFILQIFLAAIAFVVINILLIRSNDIQGLPSTKEYSVTPIIVILLKTTGEILASAYVVVGFALGVATFVTGSNVAGFMPISLPGLSDGSGFSFMIYGAIFAFLTLFFFYWISELWSAVVDTARNTASLRKK